MINQESLDLIRHHQAATRAAEVLAELGARIVSIDSHAATGTATIHLFDAPEGASFDSPIVHEVRDDRSSYDKFVTSLFGARVIWLKERSEVTA